MKITRTLHLRGNLFIQQETTCRRTSCSRIGRVEDAQDFGGRIVVATESPLHRVRIYSRLRRFSLESRRSRRYSQLDAQRAASIAARVPGVGCR